MKIKLFFILIFLSTISVFSQDSSIERNFEKNKRSFSVARFAIGEDASSGFDYLVYKKKTEIKKIRMIWSSSSQPPRVEDFYYQAGKSILYVKYSAQKNQYKALSKGTNLPLKLQERLYFTDSKLIIWVENGKTISQTDSRWTEKEKDVLTNFAEQLETYRMHLRGEL